MYASQVHHLIFQSRWACQDFALLRLLLSGSDAVEDVVDTVDARLLTLLSLLSTWFSFDFVITLFTAFYLTCVDTGDFTSFCAGSH